MILDNADNQVKINKVAELLLGTSDSLDSVLQRIFEIDDLTIVDLEMPLLERLDEQVLECAGCGWWCEASEMDEDMCSDCQCDNA